MVPARLPLFRLVANTRIGEDGRGIIEVPQFQIAG
jgi:hypothetical protein